MGLLEHNREILARMQDLRPLEPRIRQILTDGKRDQLTRGVDVHGRPFEGVSPETKKRRGGIGPPLAPRGANSRIVRGFTVAFQSIPNGLRVVMGWPMGWVKYHATGTKHMPQRDPTGVRERDKRAIGKAIREWIMTGRR